jgi:uncharacterized protein HemY
VSFCRVAEEKRNLVDPRTLCSYAQFLLRCNRHDRAEDFFLRCLERAPDYTYGLLSYANFLSSHGCADLGKVCCVVVVVVVVVCVHIIYICVCVCVCVFCV